MAKYLQNSDFTHAGRIEDEPVRLSATEARQGYLGRPVLVVLVVGILLAFVAWAGAEFFGMAIAPERETVSDTVAPASSDPASGQDVINDNQPAGQETETSPVIQDSSRL